MNALDHAISHLTDAPLHSSLSTFQPGLRSIKLNSVLTRSTNLSELVSFAELTREKPISVRFIEFMPFSGNEWDKQEMVSYDEALGVLRQKYGSDLEMVRDDGDDGTSKRWRVKGYKGEIGFISSMVSTLRARRSWETNSQADSPRLFVQSDHFCGTCNRLRITADGHLKVRSGYEGVVCPV
jgi:molybdenum cofactor biosynthesis enzyme MoaA